ncbi:MAG: choice-of-anchor D domain-containing protein [Bacteroidetes bacterium]|nr:choice-of-anchor D domain-containing protein [Bacteroidota bacterium]
MERIKKNMVAVLIGLLSPFFLTAQPGAALNFDGLNDQVRVPVSTMGAFTIEFWMRTTQTGPNGTQWYHGVGIADAEVGGAVNDYGVSLLGSKIAFGTGNPDVTITSTSNVNTGNWVHVAAMFTSNPNGYMWLYINGVLEASLDPGVSSNARNTNANIALGSIQTNIRYFNGDMDEFRLWNRVLSACEVQSRMNCELTLPQTGLLRYYQFNQGIAGGNNTSVTSITNLIAGGNGVISGMALTGSSSNFIAPGAVTSGVSCPQVFISVESNSNVINDNATTTSTLNNTNFGTVCSGPTPITNTYTVFNNLTAPLSLGNFTITGTNAPSFSVSTLPSSTIAPASSAVFGITFFPTTTGAKTAAISFTTDNCNTTIYNFALSASVIASPTITVNSGSICSGNSFVINPSGADTYTFSSGSPTVSPTSTTTYTVIGTNTLGCVNSNSALATVSVVLSPTIVVNSAAICSGQSYTLSPLGASSYTYSSGPVVTPSATTTFTIIGSDSGCLSTNAAIATITVNPIPTVSISQSNTLICSGQNSTLSASGATNYTWSTGAITPVVVISPSITTSYTVTGTSLGCSATAIITQAVSPCTSISENLLNEPLKVYPNPSNGMIIAELKAEAEIALMDIDGRIIFIVNKQIGKHEIDLRNYSKGFYFIIFTTQTKTEITKLILE